MRYCCTRSGAFTLKMAVVVKIYVVLACLRPGKKVRNCSACHCVCVCVCVCVCLCFCWLYNACVFFFFAVTLFLTAVAHP